MRRRHRMPQHRVNGHQHCLQADMQGGCRAELDRGGATARVRAFDRVSVASDQDHDGSLFPAPGTAHTR